MSTFLCKNGVRKEYFLTPTFIIEPNELFYQKAKRLLHKKYSSLRLGFFQCHGTQFPKFKIAEKKIDNLGTVYFPTAL